TFAGMSRRGTDVPSILYFAGSIGTARLLTARLNCLPASNCAYVMLFDGSVFMEIEPSCATSASTGTFNCEEAIWNKASRAVASACRSAPGPNCVGLDWLPEVTP